MIGSKLNLKLGERKRSMKDEMRKQEVDIDLLWPEKCSHNRVALGMYEEKQQKGIHALNHTPLLSSVNFTDWH